MATSTKYRYSRKCNKCNGNFIIGYKKERAILFGLIGVPDSPIYCDYCFFGKQYPREVILHLDRIEPTLIFAD